MAMRFCSAMPTLKNLSGNASRKGRMSVYLPRSAVSPTISGRDRASSASALPNGASMAARGRSATSSWPMASVRPGSAMLRPALQLGRKVVPLAGVNANEVSLLAALQRGYALAREGPQHDGLGPARDGARLVQSRDDRGNVVAVDLLRGPAEGAPFVGDPLHVEHDSAIRLDAVAVDQRDQAV